MSSSETYSLEKLAKLYIDVIVILYGVPLSIVSDWEKNLCHNLEEFPKMNEFSSKVEQTKQSIY